MNTLLLPKRTRIIAPKIHFKHITGQSENKIMVLWWRSEQEPDKKKLDIFAQKCSSILRGIHVDTIVAEDNQFIVKKGASVDMKKMHYGYPVFVKSAEECAPTSCHYNFRDDPSFTTLIKKTKPGESITFIVLEESQGKSFIEKEKEIINLAKGIFS